MVAASLRDGVIDALLQGLLRGVHGVMLITRIGQIFMGVVIVIILEIRRKLVLFILSLRLHFLA